MSPVTDSLGAGKPRSDPLGIFPCLERSGVGGVGEPWGARALPYSLLAPRHAAHSPASIYGKYCPADLPRRRSHISRRNSRVTMAELRGDNERSHILCRDTLHADENIPNT